MRKKYISPLFAELELVLEDVLFDSDMDDVVNDFDEEDGWNSGDDFDAEGEFEF